METVVIEVKPETAHRWREIAAREGRALEAIMAEALEERAAFLDDDQMASTRFQEDVHEYSAAELAAMANGEFERPLS